MNDTNGTLGEYKYMVTFWSDSARDWVTKGFYFHGNAEKWAIIYGGKVRRNR